MLLFNCPPGWGPIFAARGQLNGSHVARGSGSRRIPNRPRPLRRTVAAPQFACIFHFQRRIDGSGSFIALDGATACRGPVQLSAGRSPSGFAATGLDIGLRRWQSHVQTRRAALFVVIQCEGGNTNGFHD
jgi:hypothetical protein